MSLIIQSQIAGQSNDSNTSYFFLYESLPIVVDETDLSARQLTVQLDLIDSSNGSVISTSEEYALYDINPGKRLSIDIAKIIRQSHDADIYKFATINDIAASSRSIVDQWKYRLTFRTDSAANDEVVIEKFPIIGSRLFQDFTGPVDQNTPITEYQQYGLDLSSRWKNYPTLTSALSAASNTNSQPSNQITVNVEGDCAHGGMVIWKSRLGGWMYWGFDIKTEKKKSNYQNSIEVDYFDVERNAININPHIPVNYTNVKLSNTLSLKSLSLSSEELLAVSGISQSPVVYYMREPNGKLELMRLSSATVPISNQSNGGDFSVSLSSISTMQINTR